ncbi:MAG: aromatic acid exporter family protein [Oscillospiraceae bacterium]
MNEKEEKRLPKVGLRNLKTALAATLCAILYAVVGRNPTFACIGAIFGMGSDLENSWRSGGNRLIGTVIGGFLGMGLFRVFLFLEPYGGRNWLLALLFAGVILLILAAQIFRWPGAVQPGGVVLCIILFNTSAESLVAYSLNRMIDTAIGVAVALCVNVLLSRQRLDRWRALWQGRGRPPRSSVDG